MQRLARYTVHLDCKKLRSPSSFSATKVKGNMQISKHARQQLQCRALGLIAISACQRCRQCLCNWLPVPLQMLVQTLASAMLVRAASLTLMRLHIQHFEQLPDVAVAAFCEPGLKQLDSHGFHAGHPLT